MGKDTLRESRLFPTKEAAESVGAETEYIDLFDLTYGERIEII